MSVSHNHVARVSQEHTFVTEDGERIFYRYWPSQATRTRGAILLFHRGHEHSGRMAHLVDELNVAEFAFFAWDARGHGRSSGARGDSPDAATCVRDIQAYVDRVVTHHRIAAQDIAVLGQSLSAALLAAWAHDYAPPVRAMVLASPAFSIKLYAPFAWPMLRLARAIRGNFSVTSFVKARFLTHDEQRIASFESDPLIDRAISVNLLLDVHDQAKRILADAEAITVPTQLLISGRDLVVHASPQHTFFARLGAAVKERHVFPGFYHDTLGEKERGQAVDRARDFLLRQFADARSPVSFLHADKTGFTRREADSLASPLPLLSAHGLYWGLQRLAVRVGSWFSAGLRTGVDTGFDSGLSLDYVYRNRPTGRTRIGRWIDRGYLNAVGWQGIRQRKMHVESTLADAITGLRDAGRPTRIIDIAAGGGRYVLDAIDPCDPPDTVVLRDYSAANVAAGTRLIQARGADAFAAFELRDAFDDAGIASTGQPFTIGIVSGLYELFSDNEPVCRSLQGLAGAMEDGGYLIYTGQPWHPQLEMIARVLTSHRGGQPWVMRRRTQVELDQLVAAAGFTKISQRIDAQGMFSVSLARKSGHARSNPTAATRIRHRGMSPCIQ